MKGWLTAFCFGLVCAAPTLDAQVATIPLRLRLSAPAKEVTRGSPVSIRATLENLRNEDTAALEDVPVALTWAATGKRATLTISKGQSSGQVRVTLDTVGLIKMQADAPKLPPAFLLLVVEPDRPASQRGGREAPTPALKLDLHVVPEQVDPTGSTWTADVGVALVGRDGEPLAATDDVPVRLNARFGRITPSTTVIHRGAIGATDDVKVIADRSGTDVVSALSPLGAVERQVVFNAPLPARIRVEANPPQVVNDGRSKMVVTVMLLDADNHPTPATDGELCTTVASSLGELTERRLCIPKGDFWKETALTSTRHGEAQIVASAVGMDDGRTHARFLFPWVMVLLAVGGGILGGFVRSGKRWAADLRDNVAIAAILGLIFYALAFFGAIGAIPKVPVEIGKVAAVNELGALVLGFVGGYYRPLFRSAGRSR